MIEDSLKIAVSLQIDCLESGKQQREEEEAAKDESRRRVGVGFAKTWNPKRNTRSPSLLYYAALRFTLTTLFYIPSSYLTPTVLFTPIYSVYLRDHPSSDRFRVQFLASARQKLGISRPCKCAYSSIAILI